MSNLFFFFFFLLSAAAAAVTLPSDVAALSAFKSAVIPSSIDRWSCLASWNFTSDPCRPLIPSHFTCGITCSSSSSSSSSYRITAITLDPAGYSGTLPTSSLSNLTLLSHLDLFDNSFHGPIPSSLPSSLTSLVLSSNSFSGPIPILSALPNLHTLDLSRNSLAGPLPAFPPNTLSSLLSLDLSFNRLSGPLPDSLPLNLVQLALRGNSFSGTIKRSAFQPLKYLEVAEMAANKFEGKVEGWFFLLPSLQQVDLANNSISSIQVSKPSIGAGQGLVAVDLSFNRIEGELPAELAGFPSLAALSARHNRLRGQIPWEYGNSGLKRLFLDGNFLNGEVPDGLIKGAGSLAAGSFGDNCLEACPRSVPMCSPVQKPDWLCKQVYGVGRRHRRPSPALD